LLHGLASNPTKKQYPAKLPTGIFPDKTGISPLFKGYIVAYFAPCFNLFNQNKKESKLKDRSTIGIRLNFPFSPSVLKKQS
jgi:hypothetical protein